jgi:hypothetical protein
MDISVSWGTASFNANVDLLCKVYSEIVACTNEDIYIRINAPEDHAKCHQMHRA